MGYRFRPLVIETLSGLVGEDVKVFLRQRCQLIADRCGLPFAVVLRHWTVRLSCLLRKQHYFVVMERADYLYTKRTPTPFFNQPEYMDVQLVVPNGQFAAFGD